MTFGDIFKSSFLENVSEFSILDTLIGMGPLHWRSGCLSTSSTKRPSPA